MKDLNLLKTVIENHNTDGNLSSSNLEFNEVVIYQEMADQTSVRLNLVQQIHAQLSQLDEILARKQFVMKEIFNEIVK